MAKLSYMSLISLTISLLVVIARNPAKARAMRYPGTKFHGEEERAGRNVYHDSVYMLWASHLAYKYARLVKIARDLLEDGKSLRSRVIVSEKTTNYFPDWEERINASDRSSFFPMPIEVVNQVIKINSDEPAVTNEFNDFDKKVLSHFYQAQPETDPKMRQDRGFVGNRETVWIENLDSLQRATQCVHGILRDEYRKRIIVLFRGSTSKEGKDWGMDFKISTVDMTTPEKLARLLKEKSMEKETIRIHKGFYEYLFDNPDTEGEQKFAEIMKVLDRLFREHEDHTLYVVGHSLGGALASLLAYKLAGGSDFQHIPKPVNCITFGSPMVGGIDFQDSFQLLEREGLIRYLRVVNAEDMVPTTPPISLDWKLWRTEPYKHVGVQLKLGETDHWFRYPHYENRMEQAIDNAMVGKPTVSFEDKWFKPKMVAGEYHSLEKTEEHLQKHKDDLMKHAINALYHDKQIVPSSVGNFIEVSAEQWGSATMKMTY